MLSTTMKSLVVLYCWTLTTTLCLLANKASASLTATQQEDLVVGSSLPGWKRDTPSQWFSGFLDIAGSAKRLHYVFVQAEAPVDPNKAPVLLWLNGGPGCSSLEGFFYEHGPLVVKDAHAPPNSDWDGGDSTNANSSTLLVPNEWSWSKVVNVLYLEAPAGVGFSYSTNPDELKTGDNQTAADNLAALECFFEEKFPELKTNPFYVSGESYGGVYVPTLALKIYESGKLPQMSGFLVGNGVFDFQDNVETHVPFLYGHGFVSTPSYKAIMKACEGNYVNPTPECQRLVQKLDDNMVDVNWYDAYRTCYQPPEQQGTTASTQEEERPWNSLGGMMRMAQREEEVSRSLSETGMEDDSMIHAWMRHVHTVASQRRAIQPVSGASVPCINSVLGTKYLNDPAVRSALHVDVSPNRWQVCGGVEYKRDGVFPSMLAVYHEILSKSKNYSPRILVYNGDVDMACNYLWGEASVAKIAGDIVEDWRPWVYGKEQNVGEQLGGFVTTYDRNFSFATLHGAGHMSPQWRPEAAFVMLKSFMDQTPLPKGGGAKAKQEASSSLF